MINAYFLDTHSSVKLSAHFKVKEFASKDGYPIVFVDTDLVVLLEKIREKFNKPVIVNSGFRSFYHNNKVDGAKHSQHLLGRAADIHINGVSPYEVYKYADYINPNGGVGKYSSFTHVDTRGVHARW